MTEKLTADQTIAETTAPENCTDMAQVREGVDAIDQALISLIARRFGYMEAAARIKPDRAAVRDEGRKAQVIANVKAAAEETGVPVPLAAAMWEMMIESSIAFEFARYDQIRD